MRLGHFPHGLAFFQKTEKKASVTGGDKIKSNIKLLYFPSNFGIVDYSLIVTCAHQQETVTSTEEIIYPSNPETTKYMLNSYYTQTFHTLYLGVG